MTTFHVFGLIGILGCICTMAFLWLANDAPLVDEHEQILNDGDPVYTPEMHRDWDAYVETLRNRGVI